MYTSLNSLHRRFPAGLGIILFLVSLTSVPNLNAQSLIGLNFTTPDSVNADPQNWNRVSITNGAINNLIDDSGAVTGVGMDIGGSPNGPLFLSTDTLASDAVPQHSYDLAGMTGYGFRAQSQLFVEFTGLLPNTPYEYWFVGYRAGGAIDNNVSVSDGDILDAFSFNQFITFADNDGRFIINTTVSADSQQWNDLAFVTNSSSAGTLRFNFAGNTQTTVIGALAIRQIPEPASGLLFLMIGSITLLRRSKA